jgi:hypothetical protein
LEVDGGCLDCGEESWGELTRVDAVFVEEGETVTAGDECR